MKVLFKLFIVFFSLNTFAFTVDLQNIRLNELARLTYKELAEQQYITDNLFNNDSQLVSVYLKDRNKNNILNDVNKLIEQSGYDINKRNGITFISKKLLQQNPTEKYRVYSPKFRKIAELELLLRQAFSTIKVGLNNRALNSTSNAQGQGGIQQSSLQNSSPNNQLVNDFLIYQASNTDFKKIDGFLRIVDSPIQQIEIVTASYEVSESKDKERAIDIIADIFKNLSFTVLSGGSGNLLKFTGGSLTTALRFMDTDNRFNSISKPHARVKSGSNVIFQSGQEVPTLGAITQQNGVTSQSIDYRSSGVIMDITATALLQSIDLQIKQEFSSFSPTRTGINNSPTLNKRSIETALDLKDGEIVVIGGLQDTSDSSTDSHALGLIRTQQSTGSRKYQTFVFLQASKI